MALIIKSMQGKAPSGGPWYWTGDTWGELAWAATYRTKDDLPDQIGGAKLHCNPGVQMSYRKEQTLIAVIEDLQCKAQCRLPEECDRHIHATLRFTSNAPGVGIAQWLSNLISDNLPPGVELVEGKIDASTPGKSGDASVTISPMVLEPAITGEKPRSQA